MLQTGCMQLAMMQTNRMLCAGLNMCQVWHCPLFCLALVLGRCGRCLDIGAAVPLMPQKSQPDLAGGAAQSRAQCQGPGALPMHARLASAQSLILHANPDKFWSTANVAFLLLAKPACAWRCTATMPARLALPTGHQSYKCMKLWHFSILHFAILLEIGLQGGYDTCTDCEQSGTETEMQWKWNDANVICYPCYSARNPQATSSRAPYVRTPELVERLQAVEVAREQARQEVCSNCHLMSPVSNCH